MTTILPDTELFLYLYVRKEAVLSSQIEGTQSSLSDLLLYESNEMPGVPMNDVVEVSNYVAALGHGIERLCEGFPLSLRLIREIHEVLLRGGRGGEKMPGQFRVFYVAKFEEAVYVLHAFQKKSEKTPRHEIEVAQDRYQALEAYRRPL